MLLPNARVTFQRPGTTLKVELVAQVYPIARMARMQAYWTEYDYGVCFPTTLTYMDGSAISSNDEIVWSGVGTYSDGTPRAATLQRIPTYGLIPKAEAVFKRFDA